MILGNKNLKDSEGKPVTSYRSGSENVSVSMSFNKTNKLITALYIVTDIMEKDEPVRNKLRTLGVEILSDASDVSKTPFYIQKIDQVLSFLNIALTMNFISEMNCNVLKTEFVELKRSIQESIDKPEWLAEFLLDSGTLKSKGHEEVSNGQQSPTRIGVQKGSTLMKALSDKNLALKLSSRNGSNVDKDSFELLKKQRRNEILTIIKTNGGSATIKDIKNKINTGSNVSMSFSEKTLQRELMSMIKDGVLNKRGEKRWSTYFLK